MLIDNREIDPDDLLFAVDGESPALLSVVGYMMEEGNAILLSAAIHLKVVEDDLFTTDDKPVWSFLPKTAEWTSWRFQKAVIQACRKIAAGTPSAESTVTIGGNLFAEVVNVRLLSDLTCSFVLQHPEGDRRALKLVADVLENHMNTFKDHLDLLAKLFE